MFGFVLPWLLVVVMAVVAKLAWGVRDEHRLGRLVHSWTMGVYCSIAVCVFFAGPFVVAGRADLALAGIAVSLLVLATLGRHFIEWIVTDFRRHAAEGRRLLQHGEDCRLAEEPAQPA